jgi:hypothetical protein
MSLLLLPTATGEAERIASALLMSMTTGIFVWEFVLDGEKKDE